MKTLLFVCIFRFTPAPFRRGRPRCWCLWIKQTMGSRVIGRFMADGHRSLVALASSDPTVQRVINRSRQKAIEMDEHRHRLRKEMPGFAAAYRAENFVACSADRDNKRHVKFLMFSHLCGHKSGMDGQHLNAKRPKIDS